MSHAVFVNVSSRIFIFTKKIKTLKVLLLYEVWNGGKSTWLELETQILGSGSVTNCADIGQVSA